LNSLLQISNLRIRSTHQVFSCEYSVLSHSISPVGRSGDKSLTPESQYPLPPADELGIINTRKMILSIHRVVVFLTSSPCLLIKLRFLYALLPPSKTSNYLKATKKNLPSTSLDFPLTTFIRPQK